MEKLLSLVRENQNCLKEQDRQQHRLMRSEPDKVFTVVNRGGGAVLVPASNALGIVIRFGLVESPSIQNLKQILAEDRT